MTTEYTNKSGQRCVWVPLTNSADSWTTSADAYRALMASKGITGTFYLQHHARAARQVVVGLPDGRVEQVARLIAGATPQQRVRFDNKQSLDLRPRNLILTVCAPTKGSHKPASEAATRFLAQLEARA